LPQPSRWKWFETLGALVLAALLVWFVWRHTDGERLLAAFAEIAWPYYAAAVAALFGYQVFRTLRTRRLVDPQLGFFKLFDTICALCVINTYLPAGVGDIGIVYLLHRRHGIGVHLGAATLVIAAIADLAVFFVLFVVLIALMADVIPEQVYLAIAAVGGALLVAIALIVMLRRIAGWEGTAAMSRRSGVLGWTVRLALSFVEALQLVRSPRVLLPVLGLSAVMWIFHYLQWLLILRAVGLMLSPVSVLWVYVLFFLASFLPVRGLAAMGPRIAIWFFSLQLVGVPETQAATAALSADILLQTLALWAGAVPLLAALFRSLETRRC
jgi:uncharacterized protein (TIRG00374 family)